jgi:iron complex outermembrane receptor protein
MTRTHLGFRTTLTAALIGAALTVNVAQSADWLEGYYLLAPALMPEAPNSGPPIFRQVNFLLTEQPHMERPKAPLAAAAEEFTAAACAAHTPTSCCDGHANDIFGGFGPCYPTCGCGWLFGPTPALVTDCVIGGDVALFRDAPYVGDLLRKSVTALGVESHQFSPVNDQPIVRGYHIGQYITQVDGAYWFPARLDLDPVFSKFAGRQVDNVTIIKGPYSVRYGPGLAFIDVQTLGTPRYEGGWQVHEDASILYDTNGHQWHGETDVWGGNERFGFRAGYDIGVSGGYDSGNDTTMPAEYNLQNFHVAIGYDLSRNSRIEFKGMHFQEFPMDSPGTLYDIHFLATEAYSGRYILEEKDRFRLLVEGWFNYTRFVGNDFLPAKQALDANISNFRGSFGPLNETTSGNQDSWGGRAIMSFGSPDALQWSVGGDFHYLNMQNTNFDTFGPALPPFVPRTFSSNLALPRSHSADPGVFADATLKPTEKLKFNIGVRADWVITNVDNLFPALNPNPVTNPNFIGPTVPDFFAGVTDFKNQYNLWMSYIAAEYKANDHWTFFTGFGYGQRPPTLAELYSMDSFYALIQHPFAFYVGNPDINPEIAKQLDFGLKVNYPRFRAGGNGFFSWIHNYISYESVLLAPFVPGGGSLPVYFAANTPEAMLSGGEAYLEGDVTRWLTPFGTIMYVAGQDLSRDVRSVPPSQQLTAFGRLPTPPVGQEPLPMIPPPEARVGIRLHDPRCGRWGAEFSARIVASQDQFASTLFEQHTTGFTTVDVRSYWRPNDHILLTAGVENLANNNYFEHLDTRTFNPPGFQTGIFQPGLNFYFGARLTY